VSSGALKPIEELEVGEKIFTRDKGVQEIRWIGQSTMHATGDFAPVVIKASALNNMHDLVVGPLHRLFVFQRQDKLGAGHAKTLVRAKHLVNGKDVNRLNDGFVEYYQLLLTNIKSSMPKASPQKACYLINAQKVPCLMKRSEASACINPAIEMFWTLTKTNCVQSMR